MRDYVRARELLLVVFVVAVCCCCGLLTSVRVFDGSEAPDWRRGGLVWSCAWYVSSYLWWVSELLEVTKTALAKSNGILRAQEVQQHFSVRTW